MNIRINQLLKCHVKGQSNKKFSTEEVFEEVREVMSDEYSNLPVGLSISFREPIRKRRREELIKFATTKIEPCERHLNEKNYAKYSVTTKE